MKLTFFYVCIVFIISIQNTFSQEYIWPTDASHALTSTFCEYRPGRYHAGIDIKTWGQEGYKIFAIRSGHISRIRVSPFGYGRALYLTLDNGETVIYAHLQKFNTEIEQYVEEQQQIKGKFSIQLYPGSGKFRYQQGDLLGYTGQTGIGYPHLHFEMRNKHNQPINPFLRNYKVDDNLAPFVTKILFSPLDAFSTVNGSHHPQIFYVTNNGRHTYSINQPIHVTGRIGVAVSAYDQMENIHNKFGIYKYQLAIDDSVMFSAKYDEFSYSENNQATLDRDFRQYVLGNGLFYCLYRDIGNTLPHYKNPNTLYGVLNFDSENSLQNFEHSYVDIPDNVFNVGGGEHEFEIKVADFWNNTSTVTGTVICNSSSNSLDSIKPVSLQSVALTESLDLQINSLMDDSSALMDNPGFPLSLSDVIFYDRYFVLEFTAKHTISHPIFLSGWMPGGQLLEQKLTKTNNVYTCSWPLSKEMIGPLPLEISTLNEFGKTLRDKVWIDFVTVRKGQSKNVLTKDGLCVISFHSNSLFKDIFTRTHTDTDTTKNGYDRLSHIYDIDPDDVPLDKGADISIQYDINTELPYQLGLYYLHPKSKKWIFFGNRHNSNQHTISGKVTSFGRFCLIRDNEPPEIKSLFPYDSSRIIQSHPMLTAVFSDQLSGISGEDNRVLLLDNHKVIAEFDPENKKLFYKPKLPLSKGKHTVTLKVKDRSGNVNSQTNTFWID